MTEHDPDRVGSDCPGRLSARACPPAAAARTAIAVAASRYTISRAVSGDEAGIEGIHWLVANGIGYGIPIAIMPFLYWTVLSKRAKMAFLWLSLIASGVIFLLAVFWG